VAHLRAHIGQLTNHVTVLYTDASKWRQLQGMLGPAPGPAPGSAPGAADYPAAPPVAQQQQPTTMPQTAAAVPSAAAVVPPAAAAVPPAAVLQPRATAVSPAAKPRPEAQPERAADAAESSDAEGNSDAGREGSPALSTGRQSPPGPPPSATKGAANTVVISSGETVPGANRLVIMTRVGSRSGPKHQYLVSDIGTHVSEVFVHESDGQGRRPNEKQFTGPSIFQFRVKSPKEVRARPPAARPSAADPLFPTV
jgi:hypothetical protein